MADVHSKEVRSYNMSRIKGKNTKPELLVRKYLFRHGFRYRLHDKRFPGNPDIIFPKYKTIIFVHGCFWHGHRNCKYFVLPKTNSDWWALKIERNASNDLIAVRKLKEAGWNIIVVWECELKSTFKEETLKKISQKIRGSEENNFFY